MGVMIDQFGLMLQKNFPNIFRINKHKHWEINFNDKWVQMPEHYQTGLLLLLFHPLPLEKIFGLWLFADDYPDYMSKVIQDQTIKNEYMLASNKILKAYHLFP